MRLSDWANLHSHLVWVYAGPVAARGRKGWVDAPDFAAWLIRKGSVLIKSEGKTIRAEEGEWLFPKPGRRWQEFSNGAEIISIRYRARWPTGEDLFSEGLGLRVRASKCPELEEATLPLVSFVERQFPLATVDLMESMGTLQSHLRLQSLFSTWIVAAIDVLSKAGVFPSSMGPIDRRVLKAVQALNSWPLHELMSEGKLALEVGLSTSQLNRLFSRQYGFSPRSYFERRRIEYAESALVASSLAIKEISFQLGFSFPQHFTVWFQKRKGAGPLAFRKLHRRTVS